MPTPSEIIEFNVLDPELPMLAAEAAIDLDNAIADVEYDLKAIERLSEILKSTIQIDEASGARMFMDTSTVSVLCKAIWNLSKDTGDTNPSPMINDLLSRAKEIAELISKEILPQISKDKLVNARDFCIALSQSIMAYQQSIHDMTVPTHPFRR